jgi:acetyl-CoA synthetase
LCIESINFMMIDESARGFCVVCTLRNTAGRKPPQRRSRSHSTRRQPPMNEPSFLDDLLQEQRAFPPREEFTARATVRDDALYRMAGNGRFEAFWETEAHELEWFRPWERTLDWKPPHASWYINGTMNLSHNCLDRHLRNSRRNKAAVIWEGEDGEIRTWTYQQLHREVCKFANVLKGLGVEKGDRVAIYLPVMPETVVAMLACARIGAIHNVVFGGFSAESLAERINDSQARVLITADGGWRRGQVVRLKNEADKALRKTPGIEHVIIIKRPQGEPFPCAIHEGRDHWYHRLMAEASADCPPTEMDSEDILFILYTSGTTGKPKGIVHTTGGYAVGTYATSKYVFDLKDEDVFWCTADVGWVTGHSYVVYGPLQCGATIFIYEGAPDYPERDRFWDNIERHRVTIFYTAPTAIRSFMKWGAELPARHDLSSLRLLGTVGEPINPEAWMWYHEHIGRGNCPIVDTWWQTETGAIMISGLPGVTTMKPGFAGPCLPGIEATVLDDQGREVIEGSGYLALKHPWPAMLRTIWGDDERYVQTYFSKWDNRTYFPGDGAKRDANGNFMILGRVDDVLNVAGHRIGTMEIESALVDHPAVAESAVVGRTHEIKGQGIVAFVTLRAGFTMNADLKDELKQHVVEKIGAIARPEEIMFASDLPKTRSGKIMRRLLRDIAEGKALGDTTTLADPAVVAHVREVYEERYGG